MTPRTTGTDARILPCAPGRGLTDASRIAVVGGGPAGALFAVSLLRGARQIGVRPEVVVFERRGSLLSAPPGFPAHACATSCAYCAGGISPPMNDALHVLGLTLPPSVIKNRIRRITIQAHWKNVELRVPEGRELVCVYRGSRPQARADRETNFDAFLLDAARREGARIEAARVTSLARDASGKPRVAYVPRGGEQEAERSFEADFLVFAGGVNPAPGTDLDRIPLVRDLRALIPGFAPPPLRRGLIFELDLGEPDASLEGEVIYILHGSRDLRIEMGTLMPKGRFVTVALIGPDVDRKQIDRRDLVRAFLELPHIRRVLPGRVDPTAQGCICSPSLVVGPGPRAFGNRVAVIGDMATSRLYKDGIHSAYETGAALAGALLRSGADEEGLRRAYGTAVERLNADQRSGRSVFAGVALAFRQPVLSRMTYQAVLTERKTRSARNRRLERLLWNVATGDSSYREALRVMSLPGTLVRLALGGGLVTLRNVLTELCFGLRWAGFGRHPTGVTREDSEERVDRIGRRLRLPLRRCPILRLYTIRIRAPEARIFRELERFGDRESPLLRPRGVDVHRSAGQANEPDSVIRFDAALRFLSFRLVLEHVEPERCLVYRARGDFTPDGLLIFDLESRGPRGCDLSVLAAFCTRSRTGLWRAALNAVLDAVFPVYIHDVLWNHALCRLKSAAETGPDGPTSP